MLNTLYFDINEIIIYKEKYICEARIYKQYQIALNSIESRIKKIN